jgi:hypothetical protein
LDPLPTITPDRYDARVGGIKVGDWLLIRLGFHTKQTQQRGPDRRSCLHYELVWMSDCDHHHGWRLQPQTSPQRIASRQIPHSHLAGDRGVSRYSKPAPRVARTHLLAPKVSQERALARSAFLRTDLVRECAGTRDPWSVTPEWLGSGQSQSQRESHRRVDDGSKKLLRPHRMGARRDRLTVEPSRHR